MISLSDETLLQYKEFTSWTDILHDVQISLWLQPIAKGKATIGEIISHLKGWDSYLITTVIPAIKRGEAVFFPDFDSFNEIAYEYARSGISKDNLLNEFRQTRHQLVEILLAETDITTKYITVNGMSNSPSADTPYSLLYIIHEFIEHDNHHKGQILALLNQV
ncbi:DinB family protein [Paenibacillus lupini]|uniref:DinB family protein n=1 Tax=Paenibacillus lupini TaxID=1450204 RepID=UPI00141EDF87|nr:DinB family protein [Paenibacillus lupini]NIK21839.1 hypothetical protein [Paenibacillus lupini]